MSGGRGFEDLDAGLLWRSETSAAMFAFFACDYAASATGGAWLPRGPFGHAKKCDEAWEPRRQKDEHPTERGERRHCITAAEPKSHKQTNWHAEGGDDQ